MQHTSLSTDAKLEQDWFKGSEMRELNDTEKKGAKCFQDIYLHLSIDF